MVARQIRVATGRPWSWAVKILPVGLVLLWAVWGTAVSFAGGKVPVVGWHTRASASHGVMVLVGGLGIAVGVFAVVSLLVDTARPQARRR